MNEINVLEQEIKLLEQSLATKKLQLQQLKAKNLSQCPYAEFLTTKEVVRYSRQMIMPQLTISGQITLKQSKILIVGAGGLGCPASLYLTAAGIGELHIIDYDEVELSNLHRQILHFEDDIDLPKVESASNKLKKLNSDIKIIPLHLHASSSIIAELVEKNNYDVILDCTDNAPTRYLLNDVCVLNNIPLVSGSALQMEGQLTVYHYKGGPCYRCLFPKPPPAHTVTNCGDGGVLGPVAGVIGVLQAVEALKVLTNKEEGVLSGRMLLFDGSDTIFRNIKLRGKSPNCEVCADCPEITSLIDYEQFCGSKAHDKVVNVELLKLNENIEVAELPEILDRGELVVDVRPELEFQMCRVPKTVNLPYTTLCGDQGLRIFEDLVKDRTRVYFLCRRGNDSQRSVEFLRSCFTKKIDFFNVKGGLHAFSKSVDNSFPVY